MFSLLERISLRLRIFLALFVVILLTSASIGVLTFYQFKQSYKTNHENRLKRKEKTIIETIDYTITDFEGEASSDNISEILEDKIFQYADINDIPINLYSLQGNLLLSSEASLSVNSQIPQSILDLLSLENDRIEVRKLKSNDYTYLATYGYIYNLQREPIAIISLPYEHDDSTLKSELYELLKSFLGVFIFVVLSGGFLSWFLSKSLTRRLKTVADKIEETQMVKSNKPLEYPYNDEVKQIVEAYNVMLVKLDEQSQQLLQIEREETWREMARQVAHELKNPLTPMRLMVQNFERKFDADDENAQEKIKELSQSLIQQIDTLSAIAEAFSDFAKMPPRKDLKIDVVQETRTALEIFKRDEIQFEYNTEPIFLYFDKGYWVRILTNLVKNAFQAIPAGVVPEVMVSLEKSDHELTLSIKDNGTGIDETNRYSIFVPKFTTKTHGSGLGLPMVKKIVEDYSGVITFTNNPDRKGVTFIVKLPIEIENN